MNLDMSSEPTFPPLMRGEAAPAGADPFDKAVSEAVMGIDPGLVVYQLEPERMRAAIVLTPEAPLSSAMAMVFAASLGFADALGALAPPEVGVHFDWPATLRINGALCGRLRAAASTDDPTLEPDWLVIGLDLPLWAEGDPGHTPERTVLFNEGCADVSPVQLTESWSRHMLVWINRWMDEGMAPLHADWRARAFAMGETTQVMGRAGTFMGLDEAGGLLLRVGEKTDLIPLTEMLED